MYRYLIYLFILVISAGIFVGCSDDDDPVGPGSDGSFTISISGDISKNINGFAWFWGGTVEGQSGFVLYFSSDDDLEETVESLWFVREGSARPGTGSFVIGDYEESLEDEWNPQHFYAWYSDDEFHFGSVSGNMNISSSSDNRVIGSFQFTAFGFSIEDWENELEVTISGEFDAIGGNFDLFTKTF